MDFVEHNNRAKAKKFAEYITGKELRQYLADKVEKYCGRNPTVFDGASGSGQLEQFIEPKRIFAVEIQAESCKALLQNYPNATVSNTSFFLHNGYIRADCVVMKQQNYIYEAKAFSFDSLGSNSMKSANPNSGCREVELSKCLDTTYPCPSKNQGGIAVVNKSIIRRLTPTECEKLQGFPRNYTKIPYRKKSAEQCPDSPRYKALGNSMAVPVMCWIGKQIMRAVA